MRDTYQRGNRDALLSFAAECEARAAGDRITAARLDGEGHKLLADGCYSAAGAWAEAADLARRRAEAMPEDPSGRMEMA